MSRRAAAVGLILAVQAGFAVVAAHGLSAWRHTLAVNGRWRSTKLELAMPVQGARRFVDARQPLASGALNLAAWHGFHEVTLDRELEGLRSLDFDLELSRDGWVVAIIAASAGDMAETGVRLSADPHLPNAILTIDAGAFVDQVRLRPRNLRPHSRHHARIELEAGALVVTVGKRSLGRVPVEMADRAVIRLRGGPTDAFVDGIRVEAAGGEVVEEGFEVGSAARPALAIFLGVLLLDAAAWPIVRRGPSGRRFGFFRLLALSLLLLVAAAAGRWLVIRRAANYPPADARALKAEARLLERAIRTAREELRGRYAGKPAAEPRVLFVGSSQTWGAGARQADETFASVIQARSRSAVDAGPPLECINTGIPGARAQDLAPLVEYEWLQLRPEVVVISLSFNDVHSPIFAAPVRRMVMAARREGARPILVKEAAERSAARRKLRERHAELDQVAAELQVPVVDLHAHLLDKDRTGFLWWDDVHLTSYGHLLAAELIGEAIRRELQPQASLDDAGTE